MSWPSPCTAARLQQPPEPPGFGPPARRVWLAGVLLLAGCGRAPALPPGVVSSALLVTLDTTRLNSVGLYGCPADSTPYLDAFARESLVYDWCRAVAPITLPSHASMLTGLYPPRHGLRDNGLAPLPDPAHTLAERARDAGLATAAFVAALVLDRQYGLDQGFERYDQPERPARQATSRYAERGAETVLAAAEAWLEGLAPGQRFFLWVHLFDPHAPYEPPERFLAQVANSEGRGHPYIAEVAKTDHELGRFLAGVRARGLLESTVVMVVADHGEGLFNHGEPNHAPYVYDTTVRVPFLIRYPDGHRAGERSDEITSVVDVAPTLCEALGLEPLAEVDGLSLWRRSAPAGRGVYFESYHGFFTYGWAPLAGWADASGKYIHSPAPEFYLPARDHLETHNVYPEAPQRAAPYRSAIAALAARPVLAPEAFELPADGRLEALAALGYATAAPREGALPGPLEDTGLPVPAERRDELLAFLQAQGLIDAQQLAEAAPLLQGILAENPGHLAALEKLGLVHVLRREWGPAAAVYERCLELAAGSTSTCVNLGLAYEQLGRLEDARAPLLQALQLDPSEPTARANLARVLTRLGRPEEARAYLDGP